MAISKELGQVIKATQSQYAILVSGGSVAGYTLDLLKDICLVVPDANEPILPLNNDTGIKFLAAYGSGGGNIVWTPLLDYMGASVSGFDASSKFMLTASSSGLQLLPAATAGCILYSSGSNAIPTWQSVGTTANKVLYTTSTGVSAAGLGTIVNAVTTSSNAATTKRIIGINGTSLYYNSSCYFNGYNIYASSFYATSDRRLKENIKDAAEIDYLDVLNKIQLREFSWKTDEEHKPNIGCIAQELREVLPEKYRHEFINESVTEDDTEGMLSISDGKLTYLILGMLKAQQKEIEDLQHRIEILENK